MATQFYEGFDTWASVADGVGKGWTLSGSTSEFLLVAGTYFPSISTYAGQAVEANGGDTITFAKSLKSNQAKVIIGAAQGYNNSFFAGNWPIFQVTNSGTIQCGVESNNTTLCVRDGAGTLHALNPFTLTTGSDKWTYLEASFVANSVSGSVVIRQDGSVIGTFSGATTTGSGVTNYDGIKISNTEGASSSKIDHIYVLDGTGSINNTFVGPMIVETIYPTADVGTPQWVPDTGSNNYSRVNEAIEDGNTSYIQAVSPNQTSSFSLGALVQTPTIVIGIQPVITAEGASNTITASVTVSSSTDIGSTISPTTTYSGYAPNAYDTNPHTGDGWTVSGLGSIVLSVENGNP